MANRENKRGPKPKAPVKVPKSSVKLTPPDGLDDAAKAHWRRLTRLLVEAGLVVNLDQDLLTLYIETWSRRRQAEKELNREDGPGPVVVAPNAYLQANPWHSISTGCLKDLRAMMGLLGLSPAARAKLSAADPEEVDDRWREP